MPYSNLPDDNVAAHVSPEVGATAYHCPSTNCNGHFYLRKADLGREQVCPKCKLAVTVGRCSSLSPSFGLDLTSSRAENLPLLLAGIIIGLILSWGFAHL